MAKKPETVFKERILKRLEELPNTWALKTQERSKRGIPDLLLCMDGLFVAIELKKSDKDDPDPLQEWNLDCIVKAGGVAITCYPENWVAVFNYLKKLAGKSASGRGIKFELSH
jgi:hypothetical protein